MNEVLTHFLDTIDGVISVFRDFVHISLYNDGKFSHKPTLRVAAEEFPTQRAVEVIDRQAPGGHRVSFVGPMSGCIDYIARAVNFSIVYVRASDRAWGAELEDGSWSGMVGMVITEKADIGLGPFGTTLDRSKVVDFSWPIRIDEWRIMGARGRPEVDPWGFVFPLSPLVWAAILTTLLMLPGIVFVLSSCCFPYTGIWRKWCTNYFRFTLVLLQQEVSVGDDWWWERIVMLVWMMVTLVLTQSYAGNLMALLAVRRIPQPYQSLQDVLDDPSVIMIWQESSMLSQHLQTAKSGIFREVGDLEKVGRLIYLPLRDFPRSVDSLVRSGRHLLVDADINFRSLMAQDVSRTGYLLLPAAHSQRDIYLFIYYEFLFIYG
ncbi:glutamate receptor-like [Procambarus clarkii]|uniref:glutamate receptor-like n=1 Tax=Procambarus clarkii TaxID=6728 RepID=UPI0037431CC3